MYTSSENAHLKWNHHKIKSQANVCRCEIYTLISGEKWRIKRKLITRWNEKRKCKTVSLIVKEKMSQFYGFFMPISSLQRQIDEFPARTLHVYRIDKVRLFFCRCKRKKEEPERWIKSSRFECVNWYRYLVSSSSRLLLLQHPLHKAKSASIGENLNFNANVYKLQAIWCLAFESFRCHCKYVSRKRLTPSKCEMNVNIRWFSPIWILCLIHHRIKWKKIASNFYR